MTCSKAKHTCGTKTNASCSVYEGYLPEYSELECDVRLSETTEELYKHQEELKDSTDLSELGDTCIEYDQEGDELKVKEVLKKFEELLAEDCTDGPNSNDQDNSNNTSTNCELDFKDFKDPCQDNINNLTDCEFKQWVIDTLYELKLQINGN